MVFLHTPFPLLLSFAHVRSVFRLPITLHFRSWERQEALPSVSSSFFVLWPPAVQASQAMSYPAELLQEWATTAVRRIAVPSKETLQVS